MEERPGAAATPGWRRAAVAIAAGAGVLALVLHARRYLPYAADDAFISLRYARRLLAGQGLTWTDGERVEGYSNLLWVLACAALGRLGVDLADAARWLGVGASSAAVAAAAYAGAWRGPRHLPAGLAGALALALSAPIAVWAVAGLEQPLVAALWAGALVLLYPLAGEAAPSPRAALAPGALLALAVLTRPDGIVLAGLACGALVALVRPARRALGVAARVATLPAAAWLGQLAFRLAYHGDWVPNTARAKVALTDTRIWDGIAYVEAALAPAWPLGLAALAACAAAARDPRRRRRVALLVLALAGWAAYVVAVGGDGFAAHRFFVPALVALALLAVEPIAWLAERRGAAALAAWPAAAALVAAHALAQRADPRSAPRALEPPGLGERRRAIGLLLGRAFGDRRPLLAVDAAGIIPYHADLPALDMLGLADRHIATHRPASFGRGLLGHELGDARYVLARAPDLLVAGLEGSRRLAFRAGAELEKDPEFAARYVCLRLEATTPLRVVFFAWARRDGRVGLVATPERVELPGWLFAASEGAAARFDDGGAFGTTVPPGRAARFDGVPLGEGRWRLSAASRGAARMVVRAGGSREAPLAEGEGEVVAAVPAAGGVDVEIHAGEAPAHVVAVWAARE